MSTPYNNVKDFHTRFGFNSPDTGPEIIDEVEKDFRQELMLEELKELFQSMDEENLEDIAKELADLLYVVYGTAISYGIDIRPIFNEVHYSNMQKEGGAYREDGKLLKPENWEKPRIESLLRDQMSALRNDRSEV